MADETVSKECYDLCELENSNLRKCLAWAGKHLTPDQRIELALMIRRPLDAGGIVEDGTEQDWEYIREMKRLCVRAAELLNQAVDKVHTGPNLIKALDKTNWFSHAGDVANRLMEFDPPAPEASLAEIRNVEAIDEQSRTGNKAGAGGQGAG